MALSIVVPVCLLAMLTFKILRLAEIVLGPVHNGSHIHW